MHHSYGNDSRPSGHENRHGSLLEANKRSLAEGGLASTGIGLAGGSILPSLWDLAKDFVAAIFDTST
jgi:hypothetical protein